MLWQYLKNGSVESFSTETVEDFFRFVFKVYVNKVRQIRIFDMEYDLNLGSHTVGQILVVVDNNPSGFLMTLEARMANCYQYRHNVIFLQFEIVSFLMDSSGAMAAVAEYFLCTGVVWIYASSAPHRYHS